MSREIARKKKKKCVVPSCSRTSDTCDTFFNFPRSGERRNLWFTAIGIDPFYYAEKTNVSICGFHFDLENDLKNYELFQTGKKYNYCFKESVVPHLNLSISKRYLPDQRRCYVNRKTNREESSGKPIENLRVIDEGIAFPKSSGSPVCGSAITGKKPNEIFGNQSFDFMTKMDYGNSNPLKDHLGRDRPNYVIQDEFSGVNQVEMNVAQMNESTRRSDSSMKESIRFSGNLDSFGDGHNIGHRKVSEGRKRCSTTEIVAPQISKKTKRNQLGAKDADGTKNSRKPVIEDKKLETMTSLQIPPSTFKIKEITKRLQEEYHHLSDACAVCGQFCEENVWLSPRDLPKAFFHLLRTPEGEDSLHEDIAQQYDVSDKFPNDARFKSILLNVDGIKITNQNNAEEEEENESMKICVCTQFGCLGSLKRGRIPKFAIAQGNYIGQLPPHLRKMTHATLSLIRPVQSFGYLISYREERGNEAALKLSGHMYSIRLETTMIRKKLPLRPEDVPIRVVVTSPGCTKENMVAKGKLALMKSDYIVEKEKIRETLQFLKKVNNSVMREIEIDEEQVNALPNWEVSNTIFMIDESEPETKKDGRKNRKINTALLVNNESMEEESADGEIRCKKRKLSQSNLQEEDGGPSVTRRNQDYIDCIPIGCTVTVGETLEKDPNTNEQIVEALSNKTTSILNRVHSNTYVVRPKPTFENDGDKRYLEKRYIDLFPSGKGGFGQKRKIPISRKALTSYFLRQSTRQFQHPSFVLPVYNMLVREDMASKSFVRTKLPSSIYNPDGSKMTRGEAFSKIPVEDLKAAAEFQKKCAETSRRGLPLPKPPVQLDDNLAPEFFTDMRIATEVMQHSQAAARRDRQDVYAAHSSNGKADIWLTVTPDDTKSFQVHYYAFGREDDAIIAPPGSFRFDTVAKHPVAAALNKEKVVRLIIKDVLGWDSKRNLPYEEGGYFGIVKAYVRVIEEQGRLTLHSHWLIWLPEHADIKEQIKIAQKKDDERSKDSLLTSFPSSSNSDISSYKVQESYLEELLDRLSKNLDVFSCHELSLPDEEMEFASHCPNKNCEGTLRVSSERELIEMRGRQQGKPEKAILKCNMCKERCTLTSRIEDSLEHGYQRCYKRARLNEEEITNLIWRGLPPQPDVTKKLENDKWLLDLASIQSLVNIHDWKHRGSCFKRGDKECRYNMPRAPVKATSVRLIMEQVERKRQQVTDVIKLAFDIRRRIPFLNVAEANVSLQTVFACNNYVRYVEDQKVSLYLGAYVTKGSSENETATASLINAIKKYDKKINENRLKENQINKVQEFTTKKMPRSAASIGIGRLLSATREATKGETIGAPMAAWIALGNKIFDMSHKTVPLPIGQAIAFLKREPVYASVNKYGTVFATIFDYVYRAEDFSAMSYWMFLATKEKCKLNMKMEKTRKNRKQETSQLENNRLETQSDDSEINSLSNEDDSSEENSELRLIYRFKSGHPLANTHGHRDRKQSCWPKYLGKRVPNIELIKSPEKSQNNITDLADMRETYGQNVLIMFHPFRKLDDILSKDTSSWWISYLEREDFLKSDPKIVKILNNFQNYFESFCSSKESTHNLSEHIYDDVESKGIEEHDDQRSTEPVIHIVDDASNVGKPLFSERDSIDLTKLDPFVKMMKESTDPLISVNPNVASITAVTFEQAEVAVAQLPASRKQKTFKLPGRGYLEAVSEVQQQRGLQGYSETSSNISNQTYIELLEKIEESLESQKTTFEQIDSDGNIRDNEQYPSLEHHAKQFNLNEKQRQAFFLAGAALLQHTYETLQAGQISTTRKAKRLNKKISDRLKEILPPSGQLVLYIGGSGGTGKSRIIHAYLDFAAKWNATASSVICASTGAAAVLIEGCTLHSALAIPPRTKPSEPRKEHIEAWSEIGVLFIDEFSMIRPDLYDTMESRLRRLKNRPDKKFGGVHIIQCGDFFQLPPVGPKIFSYPEPGESSKKSDNNLATIRGRESWANDLTDVIILTENMRQIDPQWKEILERFKINQPLKEDLEYFNSRFVGDKNTDPADKLIPPPGTVAAVAKNNTREQAIKFCTSEILDTLERIPIIGENWRNRGVLLIQASLFKKDRCKSIPSNQKKYIRSLPSTDIGAVGNLFGIIGSAYMVGQNSDVAKGVANGTLSILQDIILKPKALIRIVQVTERLQVHAVFADEVMCTIFKHTLPGWSLRKTFTTLPPGCFPVTPHSTNTSCSMGAHDSQKFSVNITQIPCVMATCLTGHKFQGQTNKTILIGDMGRYKYGKDGWLYVMLCRTPEFSGIFTAQKLDTNPKKYKIRADVIKEMERLKQIEERTVERIHKTEKNMQSDF